MNDSNKIYPMLYSAIGNNAYYLDDCKTVEHRPSYAACLRKLEEHRRKIGGLNSSAPCRAGMRDGTCAAMGMRQAEELAGQALYYIDRNLITAEVLARQAAASTSYVRPTPGAKPGRPTPVAAKPPTPSAFVTDEGSGYADALNYALKTAAPAAPVITVKPEPIAPVVNVAKAGMSMVEIARAALARATS